MAKVSHKQMLLARRRKRVRKHVTGTSESPRLSVYRSLKHIYAQIIDDTTGRTLVAASSLALKVSGGNVTGAKAVGAALGEAARTCGITQVCFDRNGRLFHGRVQALAEAARAAGLEF